MTKVKRAFPLHAVDKGMSLRDYFAAKAMQSLLSSAGPDSPATYLAHVAEVSFEVADAMLEVRNQLKERDEESS